jgi:hypothetical protein
VKVRTKARTATRFFLYGAVLTSSVALSVAVTVPLAATVLAMKMILPKRDRDPDEKSGP